MSKLSFKVGNPIAIIRGGRMNGQILKLRGKEMFGGSDKKERMNDPGDMINLDQVKAILNKNKKASIPELKRIIKQLKSVDNEDNEDEPMFKQLKQNFNDKDEKELIIHDGSIIPIMPKDKASRIYVVGPSESGKTYFVSKMLKETNPEKFYLFSDVQEDELLDKLDPTRIMIDEELITNPIRPEELKNSICLFDDVDAIQDKGISKSVLNLRDSLLTRGRHDGISVICTNHLATAGNETKKMLNECTMVVIFPNSGINYEYLLKRYCALDKHQIQKIKNLPSRWAAISKTFPMFVIHDKGAYLL